MSAADENIGEAPDPALDPTRYVRPDPPLGPRETDGLPVRIVERLPEPTIRDAVVGSYAADVLPSA